jgi:hypothetical protein
MFDRIGIRVLAVLLIVAGVLRLVTGNAGPMVAPITGTPARIVGIIGLVWGIVVLVQWYRKRD